MLRTKKTGVYVISIVFLSLNYKPTLLPSNPLHKLIKKNYKTNTRLMLKLDVFWCPNQM